MYDEELWMYDRIDELEDGELDYDTPIIKVNKHTRLRLKNKAKKKRFKIIGFREYNPFTGYSSVHRTGNGKYDYEKDYHYVKLPKNSKQKQFYKTRSNRIVRRNKNLTGKGNTYRKEYEYLWELY